MKFNCYQIVTHVESGGLYTIIATPETSRMKIDDRWVPCYSYRRLQDRDPRSATFHRTQENFEARFINSMTDPKT